MRSPTRKRLTLAALACAATVVLAACGTDTEAPPLGGSTASTSVSASPSPSASSATSETPDPTPTPSATPSPSRSSSTRPPAGPEVPVIKALVAAFITADNSATQTGNYTARDKLTTSACAWCSQKKTYITKIYRGGGKVTGELFTKNSVSVRGPVHGLYYATINTTVSKYTEVDGAGKTIDARGDRKGVLTLTAGRSGASWKVVGGLWQATS
jgi:hypothetical protein